MPLLLRMLRCLLLLRLRLGCNCLLTVLFSAPRFPRHDDDGDDNHNNKTNQKEDNCNNVTMSLVGRTWHNTDSQISKLWYYQAFTDSIPQAVPSVWGQAQTAETPWSACSRRS